MGRLGALLGEHFELVDGQGRTIGGVKHSTPLQAAALRDALGETAALGPLSIAHVRERVMREVVLVEVDAQAGA